MTEVRLQAGFMELTRNTDCAIAVITPVYNGARYIAETVRSIAAQLGPYDEHVVIDDGSTDDSGAIAARTSTRARVIRQVNSGEAAAVNAGVAATNAPIVAVINADDPILPGLIESARAIFSANPGVDAVYPDWIWIDDSGAEVRRRITREFSIDTLYGEHLCIPGPGAMFRRNRLRNEPVRDATAHGLTDYDFWLRFALHNRRIERIPQFLATWRGHRSGATITLDHSALASKKVAMIERLFARTDLPADIAALREQALSAAHYNAALLSLRDPRVAGRHHALRSYLRCPIWPRSVARSSRRSVLRLTYVCFQPLSGVIHAALEPLLPPQYQLAALKDQMFGLVGGTPR